MFTLDIDRSNIIELEAETGNNSKITPISELGRNSNNTALIAPKTGSKNNNTILTAPETDGKNNNTILTAPEIGSNRIKAVKTAFVYMLVTIFCAVFGGIYECFSHGVYSFYMIYAFAFPLAGGALPFFIIFWSRAKIYPCVAARNFYHSGIATLTVGSILRGVLDIYGTTNSLVQYYFYAGIAFTIAGALIYVLQIEKRRR